MLLKGITLLDLSSLLPLPFAANLLAKQGARVLKIESPNRLDPARIFGYVPPDKDTSSCYRALNENKELVFLDLKNFKDREKFYELVKTSRGVLEGYRPDVRKRLGIEYETLKSLNPAIVCCSLSGYKGKRALRAGHDMNFIARSGILDQTRDAQGHCVMLGAPFADYLSAYNSAFRLACALYSAETTGKGCHLELSMEETLTEMQDPFMRELLESQHFPNAGGTLVTGKYPCYFLYEIPGGTFALAALEPKFWEAFCKAISREDLIPFHLATGKKAKEVTSEVLKTLQTRSFQEWASFFESVDCCIEPVLKLRDVSFGL